MTLSDPQQAASGCRCDRPAPTPNAGEVRCIACGRAVSFEDERRIDPAVSLPLPAEKLGVVYR